MKKSRIIALLTAAVMIMSVVPAMAFVNADTGSYLVDSEDGSVYEKVGSNMIANPDFEDGLTGLTENDEYYEIDEYGYGHGDPYCLKAIKSTKGEGAITAYFPVDDANASYALSFGYLNTDEVPRRPRVTFAFTDSSKAIPTVEDDFTEETNAWIGAGTASNDQDMEYSKNEWVYYSTSLKGNGNADACKYVVLNIYGLKGGTSYLDTFSLYKLAPSEEYSEKFSTAVKNWNPQMPKGNLAGNGKIDLLMDTGVEGVSVGWDTSHVEIFDYETGEYSSPAKETLIIINAILYIEGTGIRYVFDYPYIVKSVFDPYVEWINTEVFGELGSSISGDLELPPSHKIDKYPEAKITWSCSDELVLDKNGKYTAPDVTDDVDIIATIECEGETATVRKTVKALGGNLVDDGLIMYYDFEKALGTKKEIYDYSQKANVYNATGDGVTIENGIASVSGTIKLPTNYATELTGSYSVSMWVKLDESIAEDSGMYRFFDFGGGTHTSQFLRYVPSNDQLSFMDRGSEGNNGSDWAIDTKVDFGSEWKLVTLTYDMSSTPAKATIYVNGEKVTDSGSFAKLTNSVSTIATSNSSTGYIGRTQWNDTANPDFVGYMDDVRIYNRAITADEIATLYNETRPTVTAPVTIIFEDVDGNELKDAITVSADVGTEYHVPESYKTIPSYSNDNYRYVYNYISSKSTDSVEVSADGENVCKLVFELEEQPKGTNLIENGSFENGITGWTNRQGSAITGATIEYDDSIGANVMKIATKGKSDTQNIGTVWYVEIGKDYTISFDIYTGQLLDANNYQFNRLTDGFALGDVGQRENSGNDIIAWGGSLTANSWTHFEKDFTATTDTLYFQSSWSAGEMKFTNFVLEEAGASDNPEPDNKDKIPVTIEYVDEDGIKIREDEVVMINQVNTYTVPDKYKSIEGDTEGSIIYKYVYDVEATANYDKDGGDVVAISRLSENVATLVFHLAKIDKNGVSIMENGSFEDENGNFSLKTWLSCQTNGEFASPWDNNHGYAVTTDKHIGNWGAETPATNVIPDGKWAFGSKWNDGIDGLCSLANFVPVKKGMSYFVSYDYKHKTAGTDGKYISTSFVTNKSITADGDGTGHNNPTNVTTQWQTNSFVITAPEDGYIYFHFSYIGSGNGPSGGNDGNGPFWYFDNFKVIEEITFENEISYENGKASIVAEDGTTGYVLQVMYDGDGAMTSLTISEKYTFSKENPVVVPVQAGAKVMVVKSITFGTEGFLEPIARAIIAE